MTRHDTLWDAVAWLLVILTAPLWGPVALVIWGWAKWEARR